MNTFSLVPVLNTNTGKYEVKDFADNKKIVEDFINREVNAVVEIHDDITLSCVKKTRTDIRKKNEAVADARKDVNALLLGDFNAQLKEIESLLKEADLKLKEKIDAYKVEVKGVENKPHIITLVIKGYDIKEITRIQGIAQKCGLTAEIKENK